MSLRIPRAFIQDLIARVDIVSCIQARVPLKKKGANHQGLCPFHAEKTPSFTVSQSKQYYHCFGCGAHGNVVDFLMHHDHMHFVAAIEWLAARAGLSMPQTGVDEKKAGERQALYALLAAVSTYYQQQLLSARDAQAYLKKRGMTSDTIADFQVGYAPKHWDHLLRHFVQQRLQLRSTGMVVHQADRQRDYDRFRGRIMFPIRDVRGQIVGFGGRVLGQDTPKYLNSPETVLFQKNRILYGLYEAKKHHASLERLLVVEGYMDVIALAQHGIRYAVATLGTALCQEHMQQLFRHTGNLVFCFDGDSAGQNAAWRSLLSLLSMVQDGMDIRFMFLPDGKDPDNMVFALGKGGFLQRVDDAMPLADYFFKKMATDCDLNRIDHRAKMAKTAMAIIEKMPKSIFKVLMIERLAARLSLSQSDMRAFIADEKKTPLPKKPVRLSSSHLSPEQLVIALLAQYPAFIRHIPDQADWLSEKTQEGLLLLELVGLIKQTPGLSTAMIMEHFRDHHLFPVLAGLMQYRPLLEASELEVELLGSLIKIKLRVLVAQIQGLISKSQKEGLSLEEKQQLSQLLNKKTRLLTR